MNPEDTKKENRMRKEAWTDTIFKGPIDLETQTTFLYKYKLSLE
jgi:hypothetical protein